MRGYNKENEWGYFYETPEETMERIEALRTIERLEEEIEIKRVIIRTLTKQFEKLRVLVEEHIVPNLKKHNAQKNK